MKIIEYANGQKTVREMTEAEIAEAAQSAVTVPYELLVEQYIREKYTVSDELAILRQRETKPEEFAAYNTFCEACKARAKQETGGNGNGI